MPRFQTAARSCLLAPLGAVFLGILGISISGCSQAPDVSLRGLTSASQPCVGLRVDKASFELNESSRSQGAQGPVSLVNPAPEVIVGQWFRDRFKAVGGEGYATLSLENVTLQEDPLDNTGSVFQSQTVKYTCVLGLKLELFKGDGARAKVIQTSATVSRNVPDNLTVCEREQVCLDLVEQAINANDDALVQRMKAEWAEVLCTP